MKTLKSVPPGCARKLVIVLATTGISLLCMYAYSFHIEPSWFSVERVEIPIPGLPAEFESFKIVCLSDFHHEPSDDLLFFERVVRQVNDLEPDLVCLLGDYVFSSAESITELSPVLGDLLAPFGVYAVLGNHDVWTDAAIVRSSLERHGVRVLVNEHVVLESQRGSLLLTGLDDGWSGAPNLDQALARSPGETPVILMLHEPDFAGQISLDRRIDVQLSGHSHGGQIRLPFYGAPFLPAYGRMYDQGLYRVDAMWLYVTRGIGVIDPPGRFNCRPEITEITLVHADE